MAFAAAAAAASPAIAAVAPTSFPSLPSLLQHHFPRSRRTIITLAFARRFRGINPSHSRSRSKVAPVPSSGPDDGFGTLEAELWRLRRRAELRLQRLAAEADEAYSDLRSSVRVVGGDRVVLTFRRSSLRFAASALLWSLALSAAAWVLLGLALQAWRRQLWGRGWWGGREGGAVVRKRDRSLGGKEVVVAVSSPVAAPVSRVQEPAREVRRRETQARVPEWWPEMGTEVVELGPEVEKWARLTNRVVRAIIDNRIAGRDYRYDDAIQLRQLCKISGVKAAFDTENARDSFYRATTNFVLDDCSRAAQDMGAPQINGENPRIFLAGLARNIGLDKFRAATLVCASVAARTRACLLQCWALEIQGKRQDALDELVKICRIHYVFPPEENSHIDPRKTTVVTLRPSQPFLGELRKTSQSSFYGSWFILQGPGAEMEMVAAGLKKNLQVAERVHLLSLYRSTCTAGNFRTAAEALGLSLPDQ